MLNVTSILSMVEDALIEVGAEVYTTKSEMVSGIKYIAGTDIHHVMVFHDTGLCSISITEPSGNYIHSVFHTHEELLSHLEVVFPILADHDFFDYEDDDEYDPYVNYEPTDEELEAWKHEPLDASGLDGEVCCETECPNCDEAAYKEFKEYWGVDDYAKDPNHPF